MDKELKEQIKKIVTAEYKAPNAEPAVVRIDRLMALIINDRHRHIALAREIYVPVRGYEGLYEVSNFGNVRSLAGGRRAGKVLKQSIRGAKTKYKCVSLCINGTSVSKNVHRLVAMAFLSNPDNKICVNHIDGDGTNNNVENLEWATYQENERHSFDILGKTQWNKGRHIRGNVPRYYTAEDLKIGRRPISQYTLEGKLIKTHLSMKQAATDTGVNRGAMFQCLTGAYKTAGGFVWRDPQIEKSMESKESHE